MAHVRAIAVLFSQIPACGICFLMCLSRENSGNEVNALHSSGIKHICNVVL